MIEYLEGKVLRVTPAGAILTAGGVGYSVELAEHDRVDLTEAQTAQVFVHTHVREDALRLFGFKTWEEKELFALLLSLGGVGPAIALPIVEQISAEDLLVAAQTESTELFKPIKGVGPKKAKSILLDVKSKLENRPDLLGNASTTKVPKKVEGGRAALPLERDLGSALAHLGFREKEYSKVAAALVSDHPGEELEVLVRMALSELASGNPLQNNLFREEDL